MKPMDSRTNLYPLILGVVIILSIAFGYFSTTDNSIDPEVLTSIKNENPTDPAFLEKNRVLVLALTERGWFFVSISGFTLAVIISKGLSNFRLKNRSFNNYRSRLIEKLRARRRQYFEFAKRLRLAYPDLTDHDLKVAGMLMEGLSSKEISFRLNISPASVNTARYRLRKRMELSPETDLIDVLKQI